MSIDRAQINQVLYFGLAHGEQQHGRPGESLFRKEYQTKWAKYDRKAADKLFDEIGLKRGPRRHPAAVRRPAAGDHRRDGRREHGADRCAGA